ncbi:MAG: hypothetical protein ACJAWV_004240 [Flammeovirgaceae bacterium]|jgi:hypothetical protein
MKRTFFSSLFLLLSLTVFGQIRGIVIDSITNEPIPYVNIWIENENIGTSSKRNGEFLLQPTTGKKMVIFSAVGYSNQRIALVSRNEKHTILMSAKSTLLQEVLVEGKRERKKKTKIGNVKAKGVKAFYGCKGQPWIIARYFPYQDSFSKTPFIKKISFFTSNNRGDSEFNIRLYTVGEDSLPSEYLTNENIIGTAESGEKITEIDLSELYISVPKNGFFIGVEWLILDKNSYTARLEYTNPDTTKVVDMYTPNFAMDFSNEYELGWRFEKGKWNRIEPEVKRGINVSHLIMIELELTN